MSSRLVIALAITLAALMLVAFRLHRPHREYPWVSIGAKTIPHGGDRRRIRARTCSGLLWAERHPGEIHVDSAEIARQEGVEPDLVIRSHGLYPFGYSRLSVHSMISAMTKDSSPSVQDVSKSPQHFTCCRSLERISSYLVLDSNSCSIHKSGRF